MWPFTFETDNGTIIGLRTSPRDQDLIVLKAIDPDGKETTAEGNQFTITQRCLCLIDTNLPCGKQVKYSLNEKTSSSPPVPLRFRGPVMVALFLFKKRLTK